MSRHLILGVSASVALGCVGPFSEMIEHDYRDAKAAREARAVGEGHWIPDILPPDATNIHEVHNIDMNLTWGCFETRETTALRSALSRAGAVSTPEPLGDGPTEIFRDFSWWPHSMGTSTVRVYEFHEDAGAPGVGGSVVRVGVDEPAGLVCFERL